MDRFYGEIGYVEGTIEDSPGSGIFVDQMVEYPYFGNILKNNRRLEENPDKQNNDISVSNSISIVADDYANQHFHRIRYIRWAGALWVITTVDVQSPRLLLTLGDIYNGPIA